MNRRLVFITIFICMISGAAAPLGAATVKMEAETFIHSNNIGFDPIQISPEPTCSGGGMIIGLDCYNEWIEFNVTINVAGEYEAYLHGRGDYGLAYWFQLMLTPPGGGTMTPYTLNFVGAGYNWSSWKDAAAVSGRYLTPGTYTARLTFTSQQGYLQVDYLTLYSTVPVESESWGAIKALYQ